MTNELVWDKLDERVYEGGVDKGVLYLPDGTAVPWNGLTSVVESGSKDSSTVYFDGMKINDLVSFGDFSGVMKAFTYPDEFVALEGLASPRSGLFFGDQRTRAFGLSYRTKIGNGLDAEAGYKIHILYNVTAVPRNKSFNTFTDSGDLTEFEWSISAVPEEIPGYHPTAHIIIDSRLFDPWLLEDIEDMLYGTNITLPSLTPLEDLVSFVTQWCRFEITDNGDGTWTLTSIRDGVIEVGPETDEITLSTLGVNVVYLDNEGTYMITETCDLSDVMKINVIDNGDGTWTASTEDDTLFSVDVDGRFEILEANASYLNPDTYTFSTTPY